MEQGEKIEIKIKYKFKTRKGNDYEIKSIKSLWHGHRNTLWRLYFMVGYYKIIKDKDMPTKKKKKQPHMDKSLEPQENENVMLESERLIFRKMTDGDFDELAVMFRDMDVMGAWEHTFTDDQIQKWIEKQIERYKKEIVGYFAAIRKDTSEFIGQMGLAWNDFGEWRALEICYMLKREHWGMGYANEGAAALADYAFDAIGVNKVYASVRPENKRSIRVAERIGMRAEGSFIKRYNDKDMEHIIYSMSKKKHEAAIF